MYIVIRRGVYFQAVYGPYESVPRAITEANKLAEQEPDIYHDFEVYELTLEGVGHTHTEPLYTLITKKKV